MSAGGLGMKIRAANAFVTLGVQDNLSKGLSLAERKLRDFGQRAASMASKFAGASLAVAGPGLISTKAFAGFEQTMASVRGLAKPTQEEFAALNALAKKLGAETQYTAKDAADAMFIFAQRGKTVTDIMNGMAPVLNLAAAGNISVAESADLATKVMNTMQLPSSELGRVSDVLAKAAATASTDVHELGEAFKHVGPAAHLAGMSLEDTVAYMQLMSDASVTGEMAGTNLRGAMLALTSPSEKAAAILKDFGIDVRDSSRNVLPLYEIVRQFNDEFARRGFGSADKMKVLGDVFDARQASGFAAAVTKGGDAMVAMAEALRQAPAEAFAANFAAIRMNTLAGQWELFTSIIETLQITIGEIASRPLRSLLRGLTDAVAALIRFTEENAWLIALLGVVGGLLVTGAAYFLAMSFAAMAAQGAVQLFGFAVSAVRVALLSVTVSMTVLTGLTKVFQFAFIAASITVLSLRSATIATSAALVSFAVSSFVVQNALFLASGTLQLFSAVAAGVGITLTWTRAALTYVSTAFSAFALAIRLAIASIQSVNVVLSSTYFAIGALFQVVIATKAAVTQFQFAMLATRTAFEAVIVITVTANGVATTYKLTLLSLSYTTSAYNVMARLMAGYLVAAKIALQATTIAVQAQAYAMTIVNGITQAYSITVAFITSVFQTYRISAIAGAVATWFMSSATYVANFVLRAFSVTAVAAQYAVAGLSIAVRGLGIALRFLANPWIALGATVTAVVLMIEHAMSNWSFTVRGTGGEWGKLFEHVKWTVKGIYDAIVAGKWDLAFKILMSGAKLALSEGLLAVTGMFGMSIEETSQMIAELYKQFMQVVTKVNRWRAEASNWIAKQIGNAVGVDVQDGDSAALAAAAEWEQAINDIDTSKLANSLAEALDPEDQMHALNDLLAEAALAANEAFPDPKIPGGLATPTPPEQTPFFGSTEEAANFASIGNFSAATLSRQLPGAKDKTTQIANNTMNTVKELQKIGATVSGMGFAFGP